MQYCPRFPQMLFRARCTHPKKFPLWESTHAWTTEAGLRKPKGLTESCLALKPELIPKMMAKHAASLSKLREAAAQSLSTAE